MKKVLFASTALIATAGVAAADVSFGGYGRFGILYIDGATPETRLESRFRMNIDATTESDGGVTFGARVRMQADDAGTAAGVAGLNAPRFYVTTGGLTVAAGNILGALDSMPGIYAGSLGLSGLGYSNVVTNFNSVTYDSTGNGNNGAEIIYSAGAFGAHLSYGDSTIDRTELAVSYSMNGWTVAAGFQDSDAATYAEWVLTAGGKVGNVGLGLAVAQDNNSNTSATLSASFAVGAATTISAYAAMDEAQVDESAYGIGVSHSLGGGVSIVGGVVDTHGTTRADLGVKFNF
ncbi:Porin [Thalassovita gelatinovora]|uniref:Porin n=1 Tax=Thalassovita gelatinovora TaxID=53501 RepID=A0A0P1FXG8_THAGE|nr:porin [Thalassovita gelatinovora]QIZ81284.1 porin [Thalassovita gelatinovora]CUH64574.1 Porin [Thalassovita gelatinovora]SEP95838.1 outer membrane protein OmpU [Thalassovita gelatinovora]